MEPKTVFAFFFEEFDNMIISDPYILIHKLNFKDLPKSIQNELLTWAMCYNRGIFKVLPREMFVEICGWIQTERQIKI